MRVVVLIAFLPILVGAQEEPERVPLTRSREVNRAETVGRKAEERQIKIFSKHPITKAHFDAYSRGLRSQFRNMLGLYDSDNWKVPLEIYLYGTGGDVHSGNDIRTEGYLNPANRFELHTKVRIHNRFQESTYRLEFVRVLLLEQMLEGLSENPDIFETTLVRPPDWLVHGFDRSMKHRELGRPSHFYSGYLKSGHWMKVKQIIDPQGSQGLNALSLELFRASSAVLVSALCEQKGGAESMLGLLADLAADPNTKVETLIRKHFPAFRETNQGIEKWWALQLATLAQQQSFEYFSPEETERHLTDALKVSFRESPTATASKVNRKGGRVLLDRLKNKKGSREPSGDFDGSIEDYKAFLNRSEAREILTQRQGMLYALKIKAFPLYQRVIDQYAGVCTKLIQGKTDGVDRELASIKQTRGQIQKSLEQARDYLNYYEATRSPRRSDAFDSYLKFKSEIKQNPLPARTDPISIYMDKVEQQRPW